MSRAIPPALLIAALALAAHARTAPAAESAGKDELRISVSAVAAGGSIQMIVDKFEPHRKRPDPDEIPAAFIEPTDAMEANSGIKYEARRYSAGPRIEIGYGPVFSAFAEIRLVSGYIDIEYSDGVEISHPPSTTLFAETVRETTRMGEGPEFGLGTKLSLKACDSVFLGLQYSISYGLMQMHSGKFFLTEMQGECSYFLHRLVAGVELRIPVEGAGCMRPFLGVGGVVFKSKAEFEQRSGTEDWKVEWNQEEGAVLDVGVRFDAGVFRCGVTVSCFGERSLAIDVGLEF